MPLATFEYSEYVRVNRIYSTDANHYQYSKKVFLLEVLNFRTKNFGPKSLQSL